MTTGLHNITEADLRTRALDLDCPKCGAHATIRCLILRPNATNTKLTTVDVRARPCDERVTLAWREHLAAATDNTGEDRQENDPHLALLDLVLAEG
jgi:hypothetical protein